jgi:hypothetical protein
MQQQLKKAMLACHAQACGTAALKEQIFEVVSYDASMALLLPSKAAEILVKSSTKLTPKSRK